MLQPIFFQYCVPYFRHPLERLLSSYRFVFERPSMRHTAQNLCKHIYHTYHVTQNSTEEFSNDFIPTFRQFLQFVVDSGEDFDESKYVVVSHWKPYWLSCNPCHPGEDYFYCKERGLFSGTLLEFLFYANSRWAYNRNAMKQFCLLFKTCISTLVL